MGRRWKWFLRPGKVALDLVGQVVPDGDVPGRFRRATEEHVVPEMRVTSRCDGAVVYERPEERSAAARNQRAGRYDEGRAGERNQGRCATPADEAPRGAAPAEPDEVEAEDAFDLTAAELERANRIANVHWRRLAGDARTPSCLDCRDDGTCPQAAWAEGIIERCLRTYLT